MIKKSLAVIRITDLRLQTIVGVNEWERKRKQDVVINISVQFDQSKAVASDSLAETVDYRAMKKRVLAEVEGSSFLLLEKLADHIIETVMADEKAVAATVRVDKPRALRYSESVSVEVSATRRDDVESGRQP